ncbi:MAG: tetratricopeptide repeat protein [Candidatus Hydrogenedentes bacterium]|nr:tetratricopeptide repeat protein [Candidatus Hydrogenedentota bacterium]
MTASNIRRVFCATILCLAANAAEDPDQAQIDFANGLFRGEYYDLAAEEYRKYIETFPEGKFFNDALYRLGESEYSAGKYEPALAAFDLLLTSRPDSPDRSRASLRKGELLYRLKRPDEAAAVLQPLAAADSGAEVRAGAIYYLGKLEYDREGFDAAIKNFKTLSDELPEHPLTPYARYQLALAYMAKKQGEEAAIQFSAVADGQADDKLRMECGFRAAEAYDSIGWHEAAEARYKQVRDVFPDSPYAERASYGYAWAQYHGGRIADAAASAAQYLETYPQGENTIGIRYLQSNCAQQQKEYDTAVAMYRKLRDDHPDSPFAARAQYKIAWSLFLAGKTEEAKQEVTTFIGSYKDPALIGDAGFLRGTILLSEQKYEEAYQEFRVVAEQYVQSEFAAEAMYKMGECLAQLNRTDEAANVFATFATTYPSHALVQEAILRVGDAKFLGAKFSDAVVEYKRVLENSPDPVKEEVTLYRLAVSYHNMQDFKSSSETFTALLTKFPQTSHAAEAQVRIGYFYLGDGKDAVRAIEAFKKSLELGVNGEFAGRASLGLAQARHQTKDFDGAAESFLRVITGYPGMKLNEQTYAWAGEHLFGQKKWQEAATVYAALLTAIPDYPTPERVKFRIAECSDQAGEGDTAVSLYQAVVDAAPLSSSAVEAKFRMAKLFEGKKEIDKALEYYEQAATTNTGETAAAARFRIAELLESKEEFGGAAKSYLQIHLMFLDPERGPESLWRAGQCFEKASDAINAKRAYEDLAKSYPETEQTAKAKTRLAEMG